MDRPEYLSQNLLFIREFLNFKRTVFGPIIGVTKDQLYTYENGRSIPKQVVLRTLEKVSGVSEKDLKDKLLAEGDLNIDMDFVQARLAEIAASDNATKATKATGEELRFQKAAGDKSDDGLIFVPIFAQAGYSKHYLEPKFVDTLERVKIPDMPFKGERFRVFEVSDDSMEPTLKAHYHVVGERVEQEYWHDIAKYYIHVIVTEDRIMTKRLVPLKKGFVCISDNEEYYPQFLLPYTEVKEVWAVRRKMDWEMPPPKRFKLTITDDE